MSDDDPRKTIAVLLSRVMGDVRHVAKRDFNDHQRFSFRGIDAVVNAVGPALREHGVVVVPVVQDVAYDNVTTSNNKPSTACRVLVDYVFTGPMGDTVTATVAGEAWDHGDKAAPKAMSVAFRTALLQALALPTDERDPDHTVYERGTADPDPLHDAKVAVAQAWKATHAGAFDTDAMREDYEGRYAFLPLADATADQLHDYASNLLDTTTTSTQESA